MSSSRKPTSAKDWPSEGDMMQPMYDAITELNLWDKLKGYNPKQGSGSGFMYAGDQFVNQIYQHPKVQACGHSGSSQAFCLGTMQFIAKNGFDAYLQECAKYNASSTPAPTKKNQ